MYGNLWSFYPSINKTSLYGFVDEIASFPNVYLFMAGKVLQGLKSLQFLSSPCSTSYAFEFYGVKICILGNGDWSVIFSTLPSKDTTGKITARTFSYLKTLSEGFCMEMSLYF